MYYALLIDDDSSHAEQLAARLGLRRVITHRVCKPEQALGTLGDSSEKYALVILNITNRFYPWCGVLGKLRDAFRQLSDCPGTLFLCVSKAQLPPELILQIEQAGARYVRER